MVDGDQIMAILALAHAGRGHADRRHAGRHRDEQPRPAPWPCSARASAVVETAVGDRYVLEELRAGGFSLGGEQSGHVIFADHATTGDGVLTGAAPDGPDGGDRRAAGRAGRGDARGCRRC